MLGNGTGGFSNATTFNSGGWCDLVAGDFNGDGKLDLACTSDNANAVNVLLGNGTGGFGAPTAFNRGGSDPSGLAFGDFNADGKLTWPSQIMTVIGWEFFWETAMAGSVFRPPSVPGELHL